MPHPVSTDPSAAVPAAAPVAVVGVHGRFPSAPDLRGFWDHQVQGRDAVGPVPPARWRWEDVFGEPEDGHDRTYANQGGFMPLADRFDHRAFGITPREAQTMDPAQRLFLQTAWAALEDAGHPPGTLAGHRAGVFVGVGHTDYPALMRRDRVPLDVYRGTGIALTAIANRVSFLFDLRGPSEAVDTACSGSLVAIHRAVQAIHAGECTLAIAGGVNLLLAPELFIAFAKAGMLSRSGRCRTFDAQADGYVRGEGVGAAVLRPLADAERDGDFIYGVIRGSAVNHGGRAHSFTAPNVRAQAAVVGAAWDKAGVPLRRAALIETHGTGTPLGDPIEINGLKTALGDGGAGGGPIALGALKSHIGHLEAAAGIAAVIRALLALRHRAVPGNLHHGALNPHIRLDGTPFTIPCATASLGGGDGEDGSLYAGVSSFGFGGVNAHVVLQSYDPPAYDPPAGSGDGAEDGRPCLFVLSAHDGDGLTARVRQLAAFLAEAETVAVPDAALLKTLVAALGLPPSDARRADGVPLAGLGLPPARFALALRAAGAALGRTVGLADVRDCVTLHEVAQRLGTPVPAVVDGGDHLCSRTALAPALMGAVTPARIARSLMEGRDALPERLAVVARGCRGLLDVLTRYLADPVAADPAWVRGSARRGGPSSTTPPAAADAWPDDAALLAWGRHWCATKGAALDWSALYGPAETAPARLPLPACPFRLDRVWYEPGTAAAPTVPAVPAPAVSSLPADGLIGSWREAWAWSPVRPPSSLTALAVALEQRRSLTGLAFGPPAEVTAHRTVLARGALEVQGLAGAGVPRVLLQARVGALFPATAGPPVPPLETVDADAVYGALAEGGLNLARPFRCAERFERGPGLLAARLPDAGWPAGEGALWTAVLATAVLGMHALHGRSSPGDGGALRLPWRIASAAFDPVAAHRPARIVVRCGGTGPASVHVWGAGGAPALALEGIIIRPVPMAADAVTAEPALQAGAAE